MDGWYMKHTIRVTGSDTAWPSIITGNFCELHIGMSSQPRYIYVLGNNQYKHLTLTWKATEQSQRNNVSIIPYKLTYTIPQEVCTQFCYAFFAVIIL